MKFTAKQYGELEAARDTQLRTKLKNSTHFSDESVWEYGSVLEITGPHANESGLLIFIPYEFKKDFGL